MSDRRPSAALRALAAFLFIACAGLLALGETSVAAARAAQGLAGAPVAEMCSFRAQTGSPCLGCGGTEAFGLASRGRFLRAAIANPLGAWSGAATWLLAAASALTLAGARPDIFRWTLFSLAATLPAAFVVNAIAWWTSLPR